MNWKRLKKFSTAMLFFVLISPLSFAATSHCEFSEQAPDAHQVVAGDTLWDIAALFLKDPWCWPQVWEENRKLIQDPHWIYPGQTIYFKRAQSLLSLSNEADGHNDSSNNPRHWSPRIRSEQLANSPLPVLPPSLQSLLAQAPVLWSGVLPATPRIVAFNDEHAMAGRYDSVFVAGELGPHTIFTVVRGAEPVIDPLTRQVLAYSVQRVGTLRLLQVASSAGELHRFSVSSSSSELRADDVLIPFEAAASLLAVPHPSFALDGHVATVLRGSRWANQYDLVALNRGRQDGLDAGSVLTVMKQVRIGAHESAKDPVDLAPLALPAQQIGTLLVFQVAEQAALALVMRASDGIAVGDVVRSAGQGAQ
jgi:hypothetical protein